MIGTGRPLVRKRTFDWIESDFTADEDSRQTENSLDSDLEVLSVNIPGREREESGEARNWCEEFTPTSPDQLAGNKNKITELTKFLRESSSLPGPSVLQLIGPPGSGKGTALRVLGREAGMEVVEWSGDISMQPQVNEFAVDNTSHFQEGQLRRFKRYLTQSNYPQVYKNSKTTNTPHSVFNSFAESSQTRSYSQSNPPIKKLLIVSDIPNTFFRTPSLLHEVLRQYMSRGRQVLAFVASSSQDSSDRLFKLFPPDLLRQLGIATISFNPISNGSLRKVLSSVLLQKTAHIDTELLDDVLQAADGDVRFALNTLHFKLYSSAQPHSHAANTARTTFKATQKGRKKPVKRTHPYNDQNPVYSRNHALSSFHAIGKVLHAKRQPWTPESTTPPLPLHLASHTREELLYQPDHVFENSGLSADLFLAYLHTNAPSFIADISELTAAFSYLSAGDLLSPLSTPLFRAPSHYAPHVASVGLSHSVTHGISKFKILGPIDKQLRATIANRKSTLKEIAREISQIETDPFILATGLLAYHRIISYHYSSPYVHSLLSSYRFESTPHYSKQEPPNLPNSPSVFHSAQLSQVATESTEICPRQKQTVQIDSFEDDDNW